MIAFKVVHPDGTVRRFALSDDTTLADLGATVRQYFGGELPSRFQLQYQDTDGDTISVDTEQEWIEAKRVMSGRTIKVIISLPAASSSSSSSLPPPRVGGCRWGPGGPRRHCPYFAGRGKCGGESAPAAASATPSGSSEQQPPCNLPPFVQRLLEQASESPEMASRFMDRAQPFIQRFMSQLFGGADADATDAKEEGAAAAPHSDFGQRVVDSLRPVVDQLGRPPTTDSSASTSSAPPSSSAFEPFRRNAEEVVRLLQNAAWAKSQQGQDEDEDLVVRLTVKPDGVFATPNGASSTDGNDVTLEADVLEDGSIANAVAYSGTPRQQQRCSILRSGLNYIPQALYNCRTCNMVDGTVCCSACIQQCHAGHEVVFRGHGRGFCDCGAGEAPAPCKCLSDDYAAPPIGPPSAVITPQPSVPVVVDTAALLVPEPAAAPAPVEVEVPKPEPVAAPAPVAVVVAPLLPSIPAAAPAEVEQLPPPPLSARTLASMRPEVQLCIDMGFPAALSKYCLEQTNYNVEAALEKLMDLQAKIARASSGSV